MSQSLIKLPEDIIVAQCDRSYTLYFVSKGMCIVEVTDFADRKHEIREISEGGIFGEISHILKVRRTATVKCLDYVSLLCMARIEGYTFRHLFPLLRKQYLSY